MGDTGQVNTKLLGRVALAPVILTTAAAVAATAALTTLGRAARGLPTAMGAGRAAIRPAAEGSPHFADDSFRNTEPSHVLAPGEMTSMIPALIRHRGLGKPNGRSRW